jgi:hypothetical protein
MRSLKTAMLCFALTSVSFGQDSMAAAGTADSATRLPVTRVILYKNGVGYFEHSGRVRGSQNVDVDFTTAQLNDVLKSLTVLDLGKALARSATVQKQRWASPPYLPPSLSVVIVGEAGTKTGGSTAVDSFHTGATANGQIITPNPTIKMLSKPIARAMANPTNKANSLTANSLTLWTLMPFSQRGQSKDPRSLIIPVGTELLHQGHSLVRKPIP